MAGKRYAREVMRLVTGLRQRLLPVCRKVVIAGSLRRGAEMVKDAELVLLPNVNEDLFGDEVLDATEADALFGEFVREGLLAWDTEVKRNGPRYKRFIAPELGCFPIEMFLADAGNFGNTLAIRTGDAEFSKALVTKREYGGLMPGHLRQSEGYLWDGRTKLSCPTERQFFEWLGLPTPGMRERNEKGAVLLAREVMNVR